MQTTTMSDAQPLTPIELPMARSYTYALFSQLYLHGLQQTTYATSATIPELAATLPNPFDLDLAAADHLDLFGFQLFPYQSIFCDASGLLGSAESERVAGVYTAAGYTPASQSEQGDHIGHELGYLAFLCAAESEALEDGKQPIAMQIRHLQANFLTNHLLQWLPPLVLAVQRQNHPFYAALAALTLALADDHLAALASCAPTLPRLLPPTTEPQRLDAPEITLKDIADYLLCPPRSGLLLSRGDLGRLAHRHQLPRGFGDRAVLLLNLLRSAIKYGTFVELIQDLRRLVIEEEQKYATLAQELIASESLLRQWRLRIAATDTALSRMALLAGNELAKLDAESAALHP